MTKKNERSDLSMGEENHGPKDTVASQVLGRVYPLSGLKEELEGGLKNIKAAEIPKIEKEKTTKEDIDSRRLTRVSPVHRTLLGSLQISSSSTLQT
jgi:hypothetical protein